LFRKVGVAHAVLAGEAAAAFLGAAFLAAFLGAFLAAVFFTRLGAAFLATFLVWVVFLAAAFAKQRS